MEQKILSWSPIDRPLEKIRQNSSTPLPPSCSWSTLNRALVNFTGDPSSIEISRLGLDFLPVDKTLPGPSVKTQKSIDALEPFSRRVVAPDAVLDDVLRIAWVGHGVVRGVTFPLAVGAAGSGFQVDFERAGRQIVCWRVIGF